MKRIAVKYLQLKQEACGRTPPHFSIPLEACCFGFIVRHIGGTRQLPRADPVVPNQQRSQTDIPGPDQISVEGHVTVLADKEQAVLWAVRAAGMATAWAALAGIVSIHPDAHAAHQDRFIGEQLAEFGKRPLGGVPIGAPLFLAGLLAMPAFGPVANAGQVFQAKETRGMGVQDLFGDGMIGAQLQPSLSL